MYFWFKKVKNRIFNVFSVCVLKVFTSKNNITMPISTRFRKRLNIELSKDGKLSVGNNVFFNNDVSINVMHRITIGDNVMIGENVKIYDHDHIFNPENGSYSSQGFTLAPVIVGDNVWIGANCLILKGVTIGNNAVIAGGSVVAKDVPDNSVYYNAITPKIKRI